MRDKPSPDPSDHSVDFAQRYFTDLDLAAGQAMLDLGIPLEKIGASDPVNGIRHAAFHPNYRNGGGVSPDGRIVIESGVLNPDLLVIMGTDASDAWSRAGLRDRIEAVIAHEFEESLRGTHESAVEHAPETRLPIGEPARRLLRIIRDAERRR